MDSKILELVKSQLFPTFANHMRLSILRNFNEGGRPEKWKPSLRAKMTGRKTLLQHHILQNSIQVDSTPTGIVAHTSVVYAAIHNFGGTVKKTVTVKQHKRRTKKGKTTVRSHNRTINLTMPKREFFLIQNEDLEYFKDKLEKIIEDNLGE